MSGFRDAVATAVLYAVFLLLLMDVLARMTGTG